MYCRGIIMPNSVHVICVTGECRGVFLFCFIVQMIGWGELVSGVSFALLSSNSLTISVSIDII